MPRGSGAGGRGPGAGARSVSGRRRERVRRSAPRLSWDRYFMNIAHETKRRSTCDRKHVGAAIVRDRMILSTGYNGSIRGMPHCDEIGHMMDGGHCAATIHAEANAVLQAARAGVRIEGATLYTTASPCWNCFKLVANAGIRRIVYDEFYRDDRIFDAAGTLGIDLESINGARRRGRGATRRTPGSAAGPPRSAPAKSRTKAARTPRP